MTTALPESVFEKVLDILREFPNCSHACRTVGIALSTVYQRTKKDPEYAARYWEAIDQGIEHTEALTHQRAFYGTPKPLTHQGQLTYLRDFTHREPDPDTGEMKLVAPQDAPYKRDANGDLIPATVPEISDQLAMMMLRSYRPEKYRERQDINVSGQIDIATAILEARKRTT